MNDIATLTKVIGYVISAVGLVLLGFVSFETVPDHLHPYLLGGILASILGMVLRLQSYVKDKKNED